MADTHEKKAEKKVVKEEGEHKASERQPAKAGGVPTEHQHKAAEPTHATPEHVHKVNERQPAKAGGVPPEEPAHVAPVKKVVVRPEAKPAEEKVEKKAESKSAPAEAEKKAEPKSAPSAAEKKAEARPAAVVAEKKAEPKGAPSAAEKKAEPKSAPSAAEKPTEPSSEAGRGQAGRGQSVPDKASPSGEVEKPTDQIEKASPSGDVEADIIEDEEEKKQKKKAEKEAEKQKKGKKKKQRRVHPKPELTAETVRALELRKVLKDRTPNFIRQESYNYGRLGENWRAPKGTHSKLRHHISYRINVVSIGYGGPNASKGLHPSGFREVLVHHARELDGVDPKKEAARIAHGVGMRKREMIERRAERMGIRVLNESV